MAQTNIPNAEERINKRDRDVPWYAVELHDSLSPNTRKLLEEYSHIPADEVEKHVYEIRDKAWEIFPYPCIGQFRFLDLSISQSPHYSDILSRLKSGEETFLDLGCCFGQDLRKLVSDGAPSEHLYGSDLRQDFWDLGYELFQDGRALKSRFLAADIFDENSSLQELDGKVDILYASSFLHLFNLELQHNICERIVRLLKPKAGSILLGRQVGHVEAGEKIHRTNKGGKMWRHNVQSFEKMWREVGDLTGTKWKVEAVLYDLEKDLEGDPGMRRIRFAVFRE